MIPPPPTACVNGEQYLVYAHNGDFYETDLATGMRLEVDATLQYARGDTGSGWWAPITPRDKQLDSPYNTYRHEGLPPHPIANPGVDAISAVLYPEETACLYYLHDNSGMIHCAETYAEHLENIENYLR